MWQMILTYLKTRWTEPETQAAFTGAVSTTAVWLMGVVGIVSPVVTNNAVVIADVSALIVILLPGPISSAIIKQLYGGNAPAQAVLRWHKAQK